MLLTKTKPAWYIVPAVELEFLTIIFHVPIGFSPANSLMKTPATKFPRLYEFPLNTFSVPAGDFKITLILLKDEWEKYIEKNTFSNVFSERVTFTSIVVSQ